MLFATLTSFAFSWDPPYGVPASFDCATRKLAYTFGRELVPRRGSFDALWYALDLAGNDTTCVVPNLALATAPAEEKKERTWSRNTLFVDANNGVDRADRGTIEAPLRTIQSALDRVARNSQMSGTSYGTRRSQTPSPTIVLRGGIHYIAATLFIGPEHSGLEVVGHPNERSVVSGGIPLSGLTWSAHDVNATTGANIWKATVNARWYESIGTTATSTTRAAAAAAAAAARSADGCTVLGDDHGISGDDIGAVPAATVEACAAECCNATAHPGCAAAVFALGQSVCYMKGPNYHLDVGSKGNFVIINGVAPTPKPPAPTPPGPTPTPPAPTPAPSGAVEMPGLHINGVRATIARYPNQPGGVEHSCMGKCVVDQGDVAWTPANFAKLGNSTSYTDRTPQHKRNDSASGWSQYDNWFAHYMLGIGGACQVYDPPVSYWCNLNASGGGAFPFHTPSGMAFKSTQHAVMPQMPYAETSQATIFVWHPLRWANWMFDVGAYDAASWNFTFGNGGNQGARGADTGGDFFIQNVFEELDYPGEFFFNASTQTLYLNYNDTTTTTPGAGTPPPPSTTFVVPHKQTLVQFVGTQWNPVIGVKLANIEYTASAPTYMERHAVPSAGDWALDRFAAVFLQGTVGVTVSNCNFTRLDGNALMVSGYNRNTTVSDSDFSFIGGNAIATWGYTNESKSDPGRPGVTLLNSPEAGVDGTDGEHPYNTTVRGCVAREVGLYEKQSSFFVQAKTAGTHLVGNVFFNGPRAGINANDGFGGGDIIEQNLVFSACRESGDHGPFNSWDRQPFLTTYAHGYPSMDMADRTIRRNFFIDNYNTQEAVDNDDGSRGYQTSYNFLVYGIKGMKSDFGGHDNHHTNNVYGYISECLDVSQGTYDLAGQRCSFEYNQVTLLGSKVGNPQCPHTGSYPPPAGDTLLSHNSYYTPDGKMEECGKPLAEFQAMNTSFNDIGSTVAKLPSDATIIGWAKKVLRCCS